MTRHMMKHQVMDYYTNGRITVLFDVESYTTYGKNIVLTSYMLVDVELPKQHALFKHIYFTVGERSQAQTWPTSAE